MDVRSESTAKKKWEFPNVYTLLLLFCIFAALLTWIIPAGQYDRVTEGGITKVVPGSFKFVDSNPQNPWDIFQAMVQGFINQISLIMMVLFVGASVYMLEASKAIDVAFQKMAQKVKGKESIAIFVIMLIMSLGGATGVFGNIVLVLVPIGIFLSLAMGFDRTLGFAIIFFGSFSGFNVGWANFATIGIAQSIAEVPIFSGMGVRLLFHIINFILCYGFVMMYFNKIKKNPKKSLNYEPDMQLKDYMGDPNMEKLENPTLTKSQALSLLTGATGIFFVVFGAIKLDWSTKQIAATFLIVSIILGMVSGLGINKTFDLFVKGVSNVVAPIVIIGFANGITVLMGGGKILDTVVYYLSVPVNHFGPIIGANFMLLANIIISALISSGAGQATAVMPIMVPIADLTGITRQIAVQTFQFGDGFTNCIVPTVGSLMGGLAFAKVTYSKYLKWSVPLVVIQIILSFVAITVLQIIGWTGI